MTDPHTPLPWSFVPWHIEEGSPAVRAPAGYLVTTTASDANAAFIVKAVNNHDALVKALTDIAKGEGRFSRDPFTHACNTIDDMKQLALDALAVVSRSLTPEGSGE